MNHITPQEWISLLKKATDSPHQYLITKEKKNSIATQTEIDPSPPKLALPQIVEISLEKLKEVQEGYLRNERKETEYIDLTTDISENTIQLITAWETERNHSFNQLLRRIALILSALFSLVLIGIPFFLKLRKEDKKFKTEINQLKQAVLQAQEANSQAMLLKKLENIPSILKEIKERYKDHRRQELINTQMLADYLDDERIPVESSPSYDAEFERDIKNGASFLRIDKTLNIEDKEQIPFPHLDRDQRVQEAASFLQALLKKPEDQHWMPVLQIAVTHASLLTAFKAALSAFNIDVTNVQWESNGKYYSIKSIFSDQFPPVILEIIRYPKSGTIERVNVTVKGSIDIVSYNTAGNEDPKMIVPGAITEELKYSISFGEDNRPLISNLHSEIKAKNLFKNDDQAS